MGLGQKLGFTGSGGFNAIKMDLLAWIGMKIPKVLKRTKQSRKSSQQSYEEKGRFLDSLTSRIKTV